MGTTDDSRFDRIAVPYDRGMAFLERRWLARLRQDLVPLARGQVLEIGVGTGANLPFYPVGALTGLAAIDESAEMLSVAAQRRRATVPETGLLQMNAERLAFASGQFDTVVGSLVLCSVIDQRRALDEIRRVLRKPGGLLLLLEHMRPRPRPLAWLVDAVNLPWYAINGRCRLNLRTEQAVTQAGFQMERVESKWGGFLRLIVARC